MGHECTCTLSEEAWVTVCTIQWQTTASLKWRESCWKNVVRFFNTPAQKKYFFQETQRTGDNVALCMTIITIFSGTAM